MESQLDPALIARLRDALPKIHDWILAYTQATIGSAKSVASLSIPNLDRSYPDELLESTKVLIVDKVSYPPLEQFGLVEFKSLPETDWSGITYNQVYYLKSDIVSSSLHLHELVHVVPAGAWGWSAFFGLTVWAS